MLTNYNHQHDRKDCGPSCLQVVAGHYGKQLSLTALRGMCRISREGVSLLGISQAAEEIGFRTTGVRLGFEQLAREVQLPCIAHWNGNHFVVITRITARKVHVIDPAFGKLRYTHREFALGWNNAETTHPKGICLLLEPTADFWEFQPETGTSSFGIRYLFPYFKPYKKFLMRLFAGIFMGSVLQLIFPLLTQTIVDLGIHNHDLGFIGIILIAQLFLFISQLAVEFMRNRILMHVNSRVNITVISDFIRKLIARPVSFFDTRHIGDILQRISDQHRIEKFLTGTFISTLYLILNIFVFGLVLLIYNTMLFMVFMAGFVLSTAWIWFFMKKREALDYKRFIQRSENHSSIVQMASGICDIKLNNAERQKRWEWENVQARLFKINISGLSVDQWQRSGAMFINQGKNLLIIFIAASAVMNGSMTLGMMLAVMFILGQLSVPLNQLVSLTRSYQEARLSLARMSEVVKAEEHEGTKAAPLKFMPDARTISFKDVGFAYPGAEMEYTLKNINCHIPENQVTAIVGPSGCGKTTLMKLMLGFYNPCEGRINTGNIALNTIDRRLWWSHCGAVLQDGYIFSDTLMNNITMTAGEPNYKRLLFAAEQACIKAYIESLPQNYNTVVGQNGRGLSQGQKQRILIARALYKDPPFLFLDEATNALDSENEASILENLETFYRRRTVVVIAHRLSTICKADQIIVMDGGKIVETGDHESLYRKGGYYFRLVNRQLHGGEYSGTFQNQSQYETN